MDYVHLWHRTSENELRPVSRQMEFSRGFDLALLCVTPKYSPSVRMVPRLLRRAPQNVDGLMYHQRWSMDIHIRTLPKLISARTYSTPRSHLTYPLAATRSLLPLLPSVFCSVLLLVLLPSPVPLSPGKIDGAGSSGLAVPTLGARKKT